MVSVAPLSTIPLWNNPFAYGMRLLAVFYNEMEKNKDKISFIKSYQEIEKIFYKNVLRLYKDIL